MSAPYRESSLPAAPRKRWEWYLVDPRGSLTGGGLVFACALLLLLVLAVCYIAWGWGGGVTRLGYVIAIALALVPVTALHRKVVLP